MTDFRNLMTASKPYSTIKKSGFQQQLDGLQRVITRIALENPNLSLFKAKKDRRYREYISELSRTMSMNAQFEFLDGVGSYRFRRVCDTIQNYADYLAKNFK